MHQVRKPPIIWRGPLMYVSRPSKNMSMLKSFFTVTAVMLVHLFVAGQPGSTRKVPKTDLVAPLVDAAHSRFFFFSAATRPFGMVNLSPDMELDGVWNSGYRYNEDTIKAFSHIHCWELSGIPVLPATGAFRGHLGSNVYGSSYTHDDEIVKPGYHKVVLKDYGIKAELSTTTRVGFHRYTFPASQNSHILFDFTTVLGSSKPIHALVSKKGSQC